MAKKDPFALEYEIKHKNIKTGEHFRDRKGNEYTVVSAPVISSQDKKEFALVDWNKGELINLSKEALIAHLSIIEAVKIETITSHMKHATIEDENCRWFRLKSKPFEYMVDTQKYQVFIGITHKVSE